MLNRIQIDANNTNYPQALQDLDPTPTIYAIGDTDILNTPKVAILGTRRPTPYGVACAEIAGSTLAKMHITHVTSASMGCNEAAARATIKHNGTILAMAATGADVNYPTSSTDIFDNARDNGLIISMSPWGEYPLPAKFNSRNQLMAYLADAFIICESGIPSGNMTVAQKALMLNKPVFAFPGSIFTLTASCPNELIANGATIITNENDLKDKLGRILKLQAVSKDTTHPYPIGMPDDIMAALLAQPMKLTDLSTALETEPSEILRRLMKLEMDGNVIRLPDGAYSLTVHSYTKGTNHVS